MPTTIIFPGISTNLLGEAKMTRALAAEMMEYPTAGRPPASSSEPYKQRQAGHNSPTYYDHEKRIDDAVSDARKHETQNDIQNSHVPLQVHESPNK